MVEDKESSKLVGHALTYWRYHSFTGRQLYLEDIFIDEEHRGTGLARALICKVVEFASANGCTTLDWSCLSFNTPAVKFYQKLGAINRTKNGNWESYSLKNFEQFLSEKS